LLSLLEREELTVAELAAITLLAQPRVSTHLGRLREYDLVRDRKSGVQSYYRFNQTNEAANAVWKAIKVGTRDSLLQADAERLPAILATRAHTQRWADSVAGDMERHYSPGRTWEATARGLLHLTQLGDVLDVASGDGVLAELIADRSRSVTCIDISERIVAAGTKRLKHLPNVSFKAGDMHQLPFDDHSFDVITLMQALTYTKQPDLVLSELFRVMRAQGKLVATTLHRHNHETAVSPYDHVNLGFKPEQLKKYATKAGFAVRKCELSSRETRSPHFEVITLYARKPG